MKKVMNKYYVKVVETLSCVVEVNANDYNQAEKIVEEKYNNSDIVLDWKDYEKVEYKQYPSPKLKDNFVLNIEYDKEDRSLGIGTDSSSGAIYNCKDLEELDMAFQNYIKNYVELEEKEKQYQQEMER